MIIEDLRLQAVWDIKDDDLQNDSELQDLVELASAVSDTPYAVISFLDDETAHLKVRKGFSESAIPRHLSFCSFAIQQNDLLIVPDTLCDHRFAESPLVTHGPQLRFFAGMPLKLKSGEAIGTLCVLDIVPRHLNEHQQLVLQLLSSQVMKNLELKAGLKLLERKQNELQEQKKINNEANIRLRSFFESSTNFQVLLGKYGEVIDFNKTAYNFIKTVHKTKLLRGDQLIKYLAPDFVATFVRLYKQALEGEKAFVEGSTDYEELGVIWWEAAFEVARNDDNQIIGVSYIIRNVTERKLKEQKIMAQNASLLKIAHIQAHDFRAPLTSIMGLMELIKDLDYAAPKEYLQLLEQAVETLDNTIRHIVNNIDKTVNLPLVTDNS